MIEKSWLIHSQQVEWSFYGSILSRYLASAAEEYHERTQSAITIYFGKKS
jgi:hypothetical protein